MSDYANQPSRPQPAPLTGTAAAASPGKRTLVEQAGAPAAPVQQRAERTGAAAPTDADAVHAAAREGISGAGGTLPHLDRVQQLFGHHDVSNVQAHVGGAAADAAHQMGAQAYATGDHVAFGSSPDLHTAASTGPASSRARCS